MIRGRKALRACLLLPAVLFFLPASAADAPPPYKLVRQVPLGTPDKWDFIHYDPEANRVWVAHGTEVTMVDPDAGTIVGHLTDLDTSHGIVVALGRGFADSSNTKTVRVFTSDTLGGLATLPVGEDPDAMAYDPTTQRVFVMDADGQAFTAIDANEPKALSTVPLGGKPESAVGDGAGKIYANIASTGELVRIGAASLKVETRWPLPGCTSPHGLAMDTKSRRLFVSCANQVLKIVTADDGRIVGSFPIGRGTDAAAFDPVRKRIFSANADGTLTVIAEKGPDSYEMLPSVATPPGARTIALDPESGRLFLATGDVSKIEPPSQPGHNPHIVYVPGSLKLLIFEPAKP
jgi:DNA-binding beta-propeller fold protein YncE